MSVTVAASERDGIVRGAAGVAPAVYLARDPSGSGIQLLDLRTNFTSTFIFGVPSVRGHKATALNSTQMR